MRALLSLLVLICIAGAGAAGYVYLLQDNGMAPTNAGAGGNGEPEAPAPDVQPSSGDAERDGRSAAPEDGTATRDEKPRLPYARSTEPAPEAQSGAPAREPIETVRYDLPVARGAGKLEAEGTTIRFAGVDPLGPDEICQLPAGEEWPCGHAGMYALRRLIRGRSVVCDILERKNAENVTARCSVANIDINEWLVRHGWARPVKGNDELDDILETAQRGKKGQWRDVPPWEE